MLSGLYFFNFDNTFDVSFAKLALFCILAMRFIPAFNGITTSMSYLKIFDASVNLITKEIEGIKNEKENLQNNVKLNNIKNISKGNYIFLDNVSFSYNNDKKFILKNVNLNFPKGTKVVLTGKTGSGKSTLFNLMLGLLKPNKGDIFYQDQSIFYNLKQWREQVCSISQNIYLLDNTIENNITYNLFNETIDKTKLQAQLRYLTLKLK